MLGPGNGCSGRYAGSSASIVLRSLRRPRQVGERQSTGPKVGRRSRGWRRVLLVIVLVVGRLIYVALERKVTLLRKSPLKWVR